MTCCCSRCYCCCRCCCPLPRCGLQGCEISCCCCCHLPCYGLQCNFVLRHSCRQPRGLGCCRCCGRHCCRRTVCPACLPADPDPPTLLMWRHRALPPWRWSRHTMASASRTTSRLVWVTAVGGWMGVVAEPPYPQRAALLHVQALLLLLLAPLLVLSCAASPPPTPHAGRQAAARVRPAATGAGNHRGEPAAAALAGTSGARAPGCVRSGAAGCRRRRLVLVRGGSTHNHLCNSHPSLS